MQYRLLSILLLSSVPLAASAQSDFSGVWTALVCPAGVKNDPVKCAHFILELFQKHDKLCGSHLFATPGAGQMDEGRGQGAEPSLTGTVAENIATITVASNRASVTSSVQAELKMGQGTMQWRRLDKPGKNDLLPPNAHFAKSHAKTFFNPVFAQQLSAACTMISTQPSDQDRPPDATPPHPQMHTGQKTGLAENGTQF